MEVKIGIGLDNLIFGMSQQDIKSILGEPNKINSDELDFGIVYYFNKKRIKTKFDEDENFKLYTIEVYNPSALMFNQRIINKTKSKIESILKQNGYSEFEYEEYDFFDTLFVEAIWTTFTFEFDILVSFEFSPLYKDENEIIWPIIKR